MVAICAATTLGFSPSDRAFVQPSPLKKCQSLSSTHHPLFAVSGDENGDFPSDESTEYSGSVDWDAEWKKVGFPSRCSLVFSVVNIISNHPTF